MANDLYQQYVNFFRGNDRFLLIHAESGSGKTYQTNIIRKAFIEVYGDKYDVNRYFVTYNENTSLIYSGVVEDLTDQDYYYRENDDEPFPCAYIDCLDSFGEYRKAIFKKHFVDPNDDNIIYPYKLIIAASEDEIKEYELDKYVHVSLKLEYPSEEDFYNYLNSFDTSYLNNNDKLVFKSEIRGKSYRYFDYIKYMVERKRHFESSRYQDEFMEEAYLLLDMAFDDEVLSRDQIILLNAFIFAGGGRISEYDFESGDVQDIFIKSLEEETPISKDEALEYFKRHSYFYNIVEEEDVPYGTRFVWYKHISTLYIFLSMYDDIVYETARQYYTALEYHNYPLMDNNIYKEVRIRMLFLGHNNVRNFYNRIMNLSDLALSRINGDYQGIRHGYRKDEVTYDSINDNCFHDIFKEIMDEDYYFNSSDTYRRDFIKELINLSKEDEVRARRMNDILVNDFLPPYDDIDDETTIKILVTQMAKVFRENDYLSTTRHYSSDDFANLFKLYKYLSRYEDVTEDLFKCIDKYQTTIEDKSSLNHIRYWNSLVDIALANSNVLEHYFTFESREEFEKFCSKNNINPIAKFKIQSKIIIKDLLN